MKWPVRIPKLPSVAEPADDPSPSAKDSAFSAEPWSIDPSSMSPAELILEVIDHVKKLRAEVATMRAELDESKSGWATAENVKHEGSRGDMTGK